MTESAIIDLRARGVSAIVFSSGPAFNVLGPDLARLSARHNAPAIFSTRDFTAAGGLASYGTTIEEQYRILAGYIGRILAGAKPADLPVQQPTLFDFSINLKTARRLGLAIPLTMLARADEVIE